MLESSIKRCCDLNGTTPQPAPLPPSALPAGPAGSAALSPHCGARQGRRAAPPPSAALTSPALLARAMRSLLGDHAMTTTSCGSCFSPTCRKAGMAAASRSLGSAAPPPALRCRLPEVPLPAPGRSATGSYGVVELCE